MPESGTDHRTTPDPSIAPDLNAKWSVTMTAEKALVLLISWLIFVNIPGPFSSLITQWLKNVILRCLPHWASGAILKTTRCHHGSRHLHTLLRHVSTGARLPLHGGLHRAWTGLGVTGCAAGYWTARTSTRSCAWRRSTSPHLSRHVCRLHHTRRVAGSKKFVSQS